MAGRFEWKWRVTILLLYAVGLAIANKHLFGEFLPSESKLSISFLSFLFANFIVQPHYTSPKDSLSHTAGIVFVIIPLLFGSEVVQGDMRNLWEWALLLSFVIALLSASVSIIDGAGWRRLFSKVAYTLTTSIGSPRVLFTVLHFLILYSFYRESDVILGLSFVWIFVVFGQPVEHILHLVQQASVALRGLKSRPHILGEVVTRYHPQLLTIRIAGEEHPKIDSLALVPTSPSSFQVGVVLDNYRLADELWSKALVLKDDLPNDTTPEISGPSNVALKCSDKIREALFSGEPKYEASLSKVIGAVKENSKLGLAQIELYREELSLVEGQVVSMEINCKAVLYQILSGVTKSEELRKSNRHGFMQVEARKIGSWNSQSEQLEAVPWTPKIYSPVRLVSQDNYEFNSECIGFIPNTSYGIGLNCREIVTHNTAILGVLGSGKTSLAIELILRLLEKDIKVLIMDVHGEYSLAMSEISESSRAVSSAEAKGEGNFQPSESNIKDQVFHFMEDERLSIRFFGQNDFGNLSPIKGTQWIAEGILSYLQRGNEFSSEARVCLVLEEAHSLVPEWSSTINRAEQDWTNGTARAIMQGRKFGFGCLLVTQRTANVTKSILNQCNTMFALQIFDDTGKEFLQNYFGEEYASMLPTLQERNCVAYGRGVITKTPVVVTLNDRKVVHNHFISQMKSTYPFDF